VLDTWGFGRSRTKEVSEQSPASGRAEELHLDAGPAGPLPRERALERFESGFAQPSLDPLVLCGVPLDKGNAEADIYISGADMTMAPRARIQDEESWD
jgi:hypothetical protein